MTTEPYDGPRGLNRRNFLQSGGAVAGTAGAAALSRPEAATAQSWAQAGGPLTATRFTLNGTERSVTHEARVTLLDLLREQMGVTGTKKGCAEGACGACTVMLDGERVNACMVLAAAADGRSVMTVEGLAEADGTLHAVQRAFVEQDALQCGYCTPGQIVSAVACIREGHAGSEAEIAEWMSGNICRCAAYPQIVAAVSQAAEELGAPQNGTSGAVQFTAPAARA